MTIAEPKSVLSTTTLKNPFTRGKGIEISFEEVTPEMAENWLNTNSKRQRKLNRSLVRQFKNQMEKGLWRADNGEPIKFSKKGLIDGQHRLTAVYEYGKPVILMVMRNINDKLMTRLDVGKKRSLADIFRIHGLEMPGGLTETTLSSVINGIYVTKEYLSVTRQYSKSSRIDGPIKTKPSPVELYEFVMANPSVMERLSKLESFKLPTVAKNVPLGPNIVGWFICDIIDTDKAKQILMTMQECVPQTDSGRNCSSYKLFQYIQRSRMKKIPINKYEYPGLYLWALDYMMLDRNPTKVMVQGSHLPGQGHEGTKKLVDYFHGLSDIAK